MHVITRNVFITACLFFTGMTSAFEVALEFSAEAVQKAPMRPEYRANMYVSKDAVRTESTINNTQVVEIVNAKQQTRALLVPKDKIYIQQQKTGQATPKVSGTASANPCEGMQGTTCKKLADETINDRKTEKWEFTIERNGQNFRSLHWIDVKRRMPIREFYPDGTVTELNIQANETINGRNTEKWVMQMTRADGQQVTSMQWYDPELKIAIREEMQGGYVRELRNIKVGKQDKTLFQVPSDYTLAQQLPPYLMPQQPAGYPGQ